MFASCFVFRARAVWRLAIQLKKDGHGVIIPPHISDECARAGFQNFNISAGSSDAKIFQDTSYVVLDIFFDPNILGLKMCYYAS